MSEEITKVEETKTEVTGTEEETKTTEKLLSQEEVNKLVAQAKSKGQEEGKKAAETTIAEKVEQAKKLAKMNEDEKKQFEFEQLQKELNDLKKKDAYHGLSKEASKMLAEQSIQVDDDLLSFVVKDTAEDTRTAVNSFVSLINAKVEEGVKKALSGKAPAFNNGTNNAMTKKDILQIKDSSERIKAIQNNPQLFK